MSRVSLQITGATALLRLENLGKMNAFTLTMLDDLERHLTAIDRDPNICTVIVTGEGERAFCTGADINAWGGLGAAEFARHWVRDGHRIFDRLARLSKPTIAALNGHAFGGGLELAAACDLRVMTPSATLALPEARVGIVPGWSGTQRLTRLIPEPLVKEMALFGRRIPSDRAAACGFVVGVSEDVLAMARGIAGEVEALSPRATEIAKNMIHAAVGEDRGASIEALGSAAVAATADRAEGVAAFQDKRKPVFEGT
ncbi:MAG: enoyl-CoA hydratase/isomerase family protein [Pseudomonadota bacterium]